MANWFETPLGQGLLKELQESARKARNDAARRQKSAAFGRMYQGARYSRAQSDWHPATGSADSELASSLTTLRNRSRSLVRDSSYARRAKHVVVNNVIYTGIGMQAQVKTTRDELNARVNDDIEEQWGEWGYAGSCHTGGRLSFSELERAACGQVFEAGEVFIRKWTRKFGNSQVPYALELIEAERLADELASPMLPATTGNEVRMGVEVDRFYRPVAYWIRTRHPNEIRFTDGARAEIERVPADQIIHIAIVDRWPQSRGEPWLVTAIRCLADLRGYSDDERFRAKSQAIRMGIIETPDDGSSMGDEQDDGTIEANLEGGTIFKLAPGEQWKDSAPTAPNPAMDPFMRLMIREACAGIGVSYESVSRDYSQSNYSSSRLALLDDRDCWRVLQAWFICQFRQVVHTEWLEMAVLSRAITTIGVEEFALNPRKFAAVRYRPRGWSWVDPTKEVQAYKDAVRSNFMTLQDVVAAGGQDIEEVLEQRAKEIALTQSLGLVSDADPAQVAGSGAAQAAERKADEPDPPEPEAAEDEPKDPAESRVFHFPRGRS